MGKALVNIASTFINRHGTTLDKMLHKQIDLIKATALIDAIWWLKLNNLVNCQNVHLIKPKDFHFLLNLQNIKHTQGQIMLVGNNYF